MDDITIPDEATLKQCLAGVAGSLGTNMTEYVEPKILKIAGEKLAPVGILMFLVQMIAEYAQLMQLSAAATKQVHLLAQKNLIAILVDDYATRNQINDWYTLAAGI